MGLILNIKHVRKYKRKKITLSFQWGGEHLTKFNTNYWLFNNSRQTIGSNFLNPFKGIFKQTNPQKLWQCFIPNHGRIKTSFLRSETRTGWPLWPLNIQYCTWATLDAVGAELAPRIVCTMHLACCPGVDPYLLNI